MQPRSSRRPVLVAIAALPLACISASHHVRALGTRHVPATEPCEHPPIHTDHGPDQPHDSLAIVTAECGTGSEPECRRELERGACEVEADALIDVSNQVSGRTRRMVGTAVEYRVTSGGDANETPAR